MIIYCPFVRDWLRNDRMIQIWPMWHKGKSALERSLLRKKRERQKNKTPIPFNYSSCVYVWCLQLRIWNDSGSLYLPPEFLFSEITKPILFDLISVSFSITSCQKLVLIFYSLLQHTIHILFLNKSKWVVTIFVTLLLFSLFNFHESRVYVYRGHQCLP